MQLNFLITILIFSLGGWTFAQGKNELQSTGDKLTLRNADFMERDYEKGVIYLKGKVEINFLDKRLSAENAEIWYKSRLVIATGKALIASKNFEMQGERIEYDYGNDLGTIFNGAVKSGKVTFKGNKLEKKGASDFSADYGMYTACDCNPPTWSFTGYDIDAGVGSYAYVKWPMLRIANIPVFALPYIIVPLKSSRQTGLLLPTYEKTLEGGTTIGESFFWALSPSQDATLTLKNYDKRGLKTLLEYRQSFWKNSWLEMNSAFINDRAAGQTDRFNNTAHALERWYFKHRQFLDLPENYTQRLYLNIVSDLQYVNDFYQEIGGAGDPALENHFSITKKLDNALFLVDSTVYTNLLKSDPLADNQDAVHRLPEIRLSLLDRPIGQSGFSFKLDTHYVNFARLGLPWDDICEWGGNSATCATSSEDAPNSTEKRKKRLTPDGVFDPNYDLIRTGQRLDFQPTLSYTFRAAHLLDIVPSLSFRETYYQFPESTPEFEPSISRRYLQSQVSARLKAFRIYEGSFYKIKHEIVPEILWTHTPLIVQPDHKFFGGSPLTANFRQTQAVTDQDFYSANKLQFDYNDRIYDRSLITFMLANKLIRKKNSILTNAYQQVGTLRLWQTYDFIEANRVRSDGSTNKPWSELSTLFDFRFDHFETNSLFQYFPYHNVINSSLRIKVFDDLGDFAEITYTQKFIILESTNFVDFETRTENISPRLGLMTKYLDLSGGPDYNFVSHTINAWSANVGIKPPGNCVVLLVQVVKPLEGNVAVTAKFNMSFDGT